MFISWMIIPILIGTLSQAWQTKMQRGQVDWRRGGLSFWKYFWKFKYMNLFSLRVTALLHSVQQLYLQQVVRWVAHYSLKRSPILRFSSPRWVQRSAQWEANLPGQSAPSVASQDSSSPAPSLPGENMENVPNIEIYIFFIGPRSDHSLPMSVSDWLTK